MDEACTSIGETRAANKEKTKEQAPLNYFKRLNLIATPSSSALAAGEEVTTQEGRHWLVERPLLSLWPDADEQLAAWQQLLPRPVPQFEAPQKRSQSKLANKKSANKNAKGKKANAALLKQHAEYEAFRASVSDKCVFLDLETCGLAGSSIFLAGILHWQNDAWVLSQYWARNYAEERAMLCSVKRCVQNKQVLVTFNGKSFDWPQVRDRCTLHAGSADCGLPDLVHLDLLHLARQRWKKVLPDCKLQTLEHFICGRHRMDDIPGREIPAAYDEYVRSGLTQQMDSVLHHNALDLITLLEIALRWDERTAARKVG